jgi:hypothetical protein
MFRGMAAQSRNLWGWLRGDRSVQRVVLLGVFLLVIGATVLQGYYFYLLYSARRANPPLRRDLPVNIAAEETRLQQTDRDFRQIMLYRKHSREYARVILAISREPYKADLPKQSTPSSRSIPETQVPEILPPYMTVRAIFIVGNRRTALMDIESEGGGIIVEEGHSFGGGLGKVLMISGNGVVVQWSREKITLPLLLQ